MRSTSEGSVTAEVAIILPVVVSIVGIMIQALSAVSMQISLTSIASQAAQDLSRGASRESVTHAISKTQPATQSTIWQENNSVCLVLSHAVPWPLSVMVPELHVKGCALDAN